MNKALKVLAAAGLTLGMIPTVYAAGIQCDAPIPDTIRCRNADSTLQALPDARDTSAAAGLPAGRQFTHKVRLEAGTNHAFGNVLDANANLITGNNCLRSNDGLPIDNNFGPTKVCSVATAVVGAKFRVSIL